VITSNSATSIAQFKFLHQSVKNGINVTNLIICVSPIIQAHTIRGDDRYTMYIQLKNCIKYSDRTTAQDHE